MARLLHRQTTAIAIVVAMVALIWAGLGSALAAPAAQEAKEGIFGGVTAKGESSFTVKTNQGATVELAVTTTTQFRVPGQAEASFSDLAVGSRVAVLAQGNAALKVMVVPGEPQSEHRLLTVVEVQGKTIVAEDSQGNRVVVELDHEVSPDIIGQLVTFIGEKSEQSDRFKAKAEMKIEQVVKRLETHAKNVEAEVKAEANAEVKAKKERDLVELKARLEANMQQHLNLFAQLIAKAPEQAKASLQAALEMTLKGYQAELEAVGISKADAEAKLKLRTLHGSVEAINLAAGEITVQSHETATISLKVTDDTRIRIGENTGSLADVSIGDQVTVRFASETMVAAEVRVQVEAKAEGTIKSVDAAAGQVVITLSNGATLALALTSTTVIEVNDQKVTAADLSVGASVEVKYNSKTMTALKIETETMAKVMGTVKSVDAASGTATVLTPEGKEITVQVTDTTRVHIRGLLFGLLGLSAGMKVEVKYDLATGVASEIKAKSDGKLTAEVTGTVKSVDSASSTVSILTQEGAEVTVKISDITRVQIGGVLSGLLGVSAGMRVGAKYDLTTGVALELKARLAPEKPEKKPDATGEDKSAASASGTVKAVDLLARTVTIATTSGDLVLKVVGKSKIVVSASTVDVAALLTKIGANVEVQYNAEAKTLILLTLNG